MTKIELRKLYLEKRKLLSQQNVAEFSDFIFKNFFERFPVSAGMKIHVFQSIAKFNEVETSEFISELLKLNCQVFVPKMVGENLISVEVQDNTPMKKNSWGILEPVSNTDSEEKHYDYIITPLLYCDQNGNRIGYGKGFYDRFFAEVEGIKVGVGFFPPNENISDVFASDIPLDYLVTPTEVLSFGNL